MKNKIFKVCTLGLLTAILLTGCGNKEGEVSKIKKNEEINYNRQSNLDDIYGLEVYQYTNHTQLENDFVSARESFLQREEVANVDVLSKEDDIYEAIITFDADWYTEKEYGYILYIKNDKDYINLYQISNNKNKDNIIKIGEELKQKFTKSSDFKKVFEEYVKENKLTTGHAYGCNGIVSCTTSLSATNIREVEPGKSDKKVKTVELNNYEISPNTFIGIIEATDEDGEIVWSKKWSNIPYGIGFVGLLFEQAGDYYYLTSDNETGTISYLEAYDIQTSKLVWKESFQQDMRNDLVSVNGKLFIYEGDMDGSIEVKDEKNGKTIYFEEELNKYFTKELGEDLSNYSISKSTVVDDNIVYDVKEYETEKIIGKLKVNINDYKIVFKK